MPKRHITEWQCNRCGNEEATQTGKPNGWRAFHGVSAYTENRYDPGKLTDDEQAVRGDICPYCVSSLIEWWQRRDRQRYADAPSVPAEPTGAR